MERKNEVNDDLWSEADDRQENAVPVPRLKEWFSFNLFFSPSRGSLVVSSSWNPALALEISSLVSYS